MTQPEDFDRVESFTSAEQFQSRPNYFPQLRVHPDELGRIVGKYTLPGKQRINCGLNGCNEPHRHGFLINTKDGRETHCGNRCGHREFGVKFEEVEARANRAIEMQSIRSVVESTLQKKAELLKRAERVRPLCLDAEQRVEALRHELRKHSRFWTHVESAAKLGGSIRGEVEAPPDPMARQQGRPRKLMQTFEVISGAGLLRSEVTHHSNIVQKNVIEWLSQLSADSMPTDKRALDALTKSAGACEDSLRRAERFVTDAAALLDAANLRKLQAIPDRLMRAADITPGLRATLDALGQRGVTVGGPARRG